MPPLRNRLLLSLGPWKCEFDRAARRLTRDGRTLDLPPKVHQLLEVLIDRRPSVVTQQELRDLLWPSTIVGYGSLAQVVRELRRALGPENRAHIRTVHRVGYAFDGSVREETRPSLGGYELRCPTWNRQALPLREGANVVGRDLDCECRITSGGVSGHHACIVVRGPEVRLFDLGSRNGTRVAGERILGSKSLCHGDIIVFGDIPAILQAVARTGATGTPAG